MAITAQLIASDKEVLFDEVDWCASCIQVKLARHQELMKAAQPVDVPVESPVEIVAAKE
jgi:hypothetical protein